MKKQQLTIRTQAFDLDLDHVEDAIEKLSELRKTINTSPVWIEFSSRYEGDTSMSLCYNREETDEEAENRLGIAKASRRKQYENLKKEFENE